MYERILIPLDGSELGEAAIPFAELIPSHHVRLLHVDHGVVASIGERSEADASAPQVERAAKTLAYLESLSAGLRRQGREVEIALDVGDPRSRIIVAAADADLIVMGSRGHSVAGRTFGVSIADHVVRNARVPTLVVRGEVADVAPSVSRIVVPLDGSPSAEQALVAAARLSNLLGLRPHLMHVIPTVTHPANDEARRHEAAAYLARQAMRLASKDLSATQEVLAGPVATTLLAGIRPTDLVVMTARGAGRKRAPMGGIAERLVREAESPILLLH